MSRSPTTLYVGTNVEQKAKPVQFELEDAKVLCIDFGAYCAIESATLSSASWTILNGTGVVTKGAPTTTTKKTQCLITAADTGIEIVQVESVFSNSERLIHLFRCEVTDSEITLAGKLDNYA